MLTLAISLGEVRMPSVTQPVGTEVFRCTKGLRLGADFAITCLVKVSPELHAGCTKVAVLRGNSASPSVD